MNRASRDRAAALLAFALGAAGCRDRDRDPVPTDIDGDGLTNDVDLDDDGDGLPDEIDVDDDGDGGFDRPAPQDIIDAAAAAAAAYCEYGELCCGFTMRFESGGDGIDACEERLRQELEVEFVQAAAVAGAAPDWSFSNEHGLINFPSPAALRCPEATVEKGQRVRFETIDMFLLPFFHGTTEEGQPCVTAWDCGRRLRCEGLAENPWMPGVCAPLPTEGTGCGATEPVCPVGTSCTATGEREICERPHLVNEACLVFDFDGKTTDNCAADQWCDATLEEPVCRPVLREGDPCAEDRQCLAFDCPAPDHECPLNHPLYVAAHAVALEWCAEMFPTLEPLPQ